MQVASTDVEAALWGAKTNEDLCNGNAIVINSEQGNENMGEVHCKVSSPRNINTNSQIENGKMRKRCGKANSIARKKCVKRDKKVGSGTRAASKEASVNLVEKQRINSNGNSLIMKKSRNQSKSIGKGGSATEPRPENVLAVSVRTEIPDQGGKNMVSDLPPSMGKKQDIHLKIRQKCRKINSQCEEDSCTRSKRRKVDSTKVDMLEKIPMVQKQTDEDTVPQPSLISTCIGANKKTSDLKKKPTRSTRKKSALNSKCNVESRCSKRMKVSYGISEDGLIKDNGVQECCNKAPNKTQSLEESQGIADVRVLNDLSREKGLKTDKVALRKCETLSTKIQCSFCHSSEDSEVILLLYLPIDSQPNPSNSLMCMTT